MRVEGSAWYNRAWALHTFVSMKPCTTCHCEGVVITALEPLDVPDEGLVHTSVYPSITYNPVWLLAA